MGGQGGQFPTLVLADQLTLSQPEGADCATHITTGQPSAVLGTFLRHWLISVDYSASWAQKDMQYCFIILRY